MSFTTDWVAHHAAYKPAAIALHGLDDGETRSWAALEARVARLAGALRHDHGLAPGDRVAALTDGNIRVLELQFACIRAGLTFVPLNFRLTASELTDMCRRLAPRLLVTDDSWRALARQVGAASGNLAVIDWVGTASDYEAMATAGPQMSPRTDMHPDQVALILFTSGSTGAPKAAMCTLRALVWQAFNQAAASGVAEAGAHVFTPLPLFHAGGLNSLTNPVLFFGGKATISARFDPATAARLMGDRASAVTHVALVPLMYDLIADVPDFATGDFSSLRTAIVAGGRLTATLLDKWRATGVRFSPQYGGTETGPSVTALNPDDVNKAVAGSCGSKVMFVDIRLVDAEGRDVPPGHPGEVWLRGPAITPGYIGREPELDFTDGWFRTGDVARVDDDGCYFLVDRLKDMYKSGGENVSSAEVELVLAEHPAVAEVAVIGIGHPKWGEVGLAVVVPRAGASLTVEQLRESCTGRLARFKQPQALELLEALPRNVTGKVVKDELRRRFGGTVVA
jgi:fatty-acyl-CoA synthase